MSVIHIYTSCGRGNHLKTSCARRQGKLCMTWKKCPTMFYFGMTISISEVKTTNQTPYFVSMTTRYDVVFYLRLLGGKINC